MVATAPDARVKMTGVSPILIAGLLPAMRATRVDLLEALAEWTSLGACSSLLPRI